MKDTSRKHFCLFFPPPFNFFFKRWKNDRHPFYFNVHRMSVGWVMSQLSLAAEVVWLLELTATKRPNSAVMSMAEEAGITHFKTLLQRWAHSVYCFSWTWDFTDICQVHTKSLFITQSRCYCHNTVNHESGSTHCVMREKTSGKADWSCDAGSGVVITESTQAWGGLLDSF